MPYITRSSERVTDETVAQAIRLLLALVQKSWGRLKTRGLVYGMGTGRYLGYTRRERV